MSISEFTYTNVDEVVEWTYRLRKPGIQLQRKIFRWTGAGYLWRRRILKGLYDCVFESFDSIRSISHVTTYLARNLHYSHNIGKKLHSVTHFSA